MRKPRNRRIQNPEAHIGQEFNGIKILSIDHIAEGDLEISCRCKCPCGNEFNAPLWRVVSSVQKSCGMCGNGQSVRPIKLRKDLTGKQFGKLTVLGLAGRNSQNRITYTCECECGNTTIVASNNLISGNTKSCGRCNYARSATAEGLRIYATPEEAHLADCVYSDMKRRCYDPKFPEYKHYGAKGIGMCQEWKDSPKAYVDWCMAHGWKPGLSVDRIDNSKGYSPDNCRIADDFQQANNKSNNRRVTVDGVEHTAAEWARITGIKYDNLRNKTDERMIEIIRASLANQGTTS